MGYPLSDLRVFGIRKKKTDFRMKRRSSKTGDPMLKSKMQDSRSKLFCQREICYVLNENYDNIQEKLFKIIDLSVLNASMETRLTSIHPRAGSRTRLFDFDIASKDRYKMKGFLKDRQTHNHT
jgi:hypothetical protein